MQIFTTFLIPFYLLFHRYLPIELFDTLIFSNVKTDFCSVFALNNCPRESYDGL